MCLLTQHQISQAVSVLGLAHAIHKQIKKTPFHESLSASTVHRNLGYDENLCEKQVGLFTVHDIGHFCTSALIL